LQEPRSVGSENEPAYVPNPGAFFFIGGEMFRLKGMRYKIQAAPTQEQELAIKDMQDQLVANGIVFEEEEVKIFTTGWVATAEEALELFKEIKETEDSLVTAKDEFAQKIKDAEQFAK
jgi:hypothetical protein